MDSRERPQDDATPWLTDEKRSVKPPVVPPKQGPWWGRFLGGGDAESRAPRKQAPRAPKGVGGLIPFDAPCDAETVVASRDELLRMVAEYTASRRKPKDQTSKGSPAEPPEEPEVVDEPSTLPVPAKGDIFEELAQRRSLAPPPEPPEDPPLPDAAPLRVLPARPFETPPRKDARSTEERMFETSSPKRGGAAEERLPPRKGASAAEERLPPRKGGRPANDVVDPDGSSTQPGTSPVQPRRRVSDANPPTKKGRPSGPSAMERERVLAHPPSKRQPPPAEPSLSSFGSVGGPNENERPYPQRFYTLGLRLIKTRRWPEALDFYADEVKRRPFDSDGYYGTAAAQLGIGDLEQAAHELVRGYEIDPLFPIGRLVADACPVDPLMWYNLAAVLVSLRKRAAYMIAEQILVECLGGSEDTRLRNRAERVKKDIGRMLESRQFRDEFRKQTSPDPWFAYLRHPAVAAAILVLAAFSVWLVWGHNAPAPAPPAVAPSAMASEVPHSPAPSSLPSRHPR